MLWLVGPHWPVGLRLVMALALESAWEVFENTDFVMNRYREATIALDYDGDNVLNSLSDIGAMVAGFWLASRLDVRTVIALAIGFDLFVGWAIRDNLTLKILMLIHPIEAIREWQAAE